MSAIDSKAEEADSASEVKPPSITEPKDIMADLELEPVSDEDSPFGDFDSGKESSDGEAEDDKEVAQKPVDEVKPAIVAGEKARQIKEPELDPDVSDEGEIKSDSEEAVDEEEKERQAKKTPIELVDFGEAAKRAREARSSYYSESVDRRAPARVSAVPPGGNPNYRKGYTSWNVTE